jgi:glycosyltransferase involved in cell wall biosynthesis
MGAAARKRVRAEFTWERTAERFLEQLAAIEGGGGQ